MAKKARRTSGTAARAATIDPADLPVVGRREPCPCGSGRRYKDCHEPRVAAAAAQPVTRPFAGLPAECDWVALREIVPAATAAVRTSAAHGAKDATIATVLPMAWPGLHRADGTVLAALQTSLTSRTDPARDVAATLLAAWAGEPGRAVSPDEAPEQVPPLTELLDLDVPFEVRIHDTFEFWLEDASGIDGEVRDSLERANASIVPTVRLEGVEAAYWCRVGHRRHLRWVMPEDEEALLDGIARLHAAGASSLGDGSRYVGAFRADGLLVPVWDLADDAEAEDVEAPARAFHERLHDALAVTAPLTLDERRARSGLVSRQLTLR
ncbi:MAG: DUF5926 family protein [Kineosporiaceae bacterium]